MSRVDFFDMPEVTAILDEFCEVHDGHEEPDWQAVQDILVNTYQPLHSLTLNLLKALHFMYEEDFESAFTQIWARKHGLI